MKLKSEKDKVLFNNVKEGKCINDTYGDGSTTLHFACSEGHENVVKILLDNGADVTIKDKEGKMPIVHSYGYPTIVKKLTEKIPAITADELKKYWGYLKRLNIEKFKERRKFNNMGKKDIYAKSSDYVEEHFKKIQDKLKGEGHFTQKQLNDSVPESTEVDKLVGVETSKSNNYKIKF